MKVGMFLKEYIKASKKDIDVILNIVQMSITSTYPKYYPKEVVDFFSNLHCKENILNDINDELVGMLLIDGVCVGTGCYRENHITRVYVLPEQQGNGYGSYIMNCLESIISANYSKALLDASLPASHLYEKRGYSTIEHCKYPVKNEVVLVYEVMEKELITNKTRIDYNGKIFVPLVNTDNGEVDSNTVFYYHQNGNDFSADYSGGEIKKGYMIGKVSDNGELDFYYQHINVDDEIRAGRCHSIPRLNNDGKFEMYEEWQWLNGDCTSGKSVVVEQ